MNSDYLELARDQIINTFGELSPLHESVIQLAFKKHSNQFRKNSNLPYFSHLVHVAKNVIDEYMFIFGVVGINLETLSDLVIVAYWHDIVEDTDTTLGNLRDVLSMHLTDQKRIESILTGIYLVTKKKDKFDILVYLLDIKQNLYAYMVKMADLKHNMSDLKAGNLLDKYKLCKYILVNNNI